MSIFGKKPEQEANKPSTPTPVQPMPAPAPPPPQPKPQPKASTPPVAAAEKRSFLGKGCKFKGKLTGKGSFECGGSLEGDVDITGDASVSHGGSAKAQLRARRISIDGRLDGNAIAVEKVEVGASGHVEGDVRAPAVQFAEGAFFEGNVEMRRPKSDAGASDDEKRGSGGQPSGTGADAASGDSR